MTAKQPELNQEARQILNDAISAAGLRTTKQRDHIFATLLQTRDHPTVDEVYERAKMSMRQISRATVYNCLETLVNCGLVKQISLEREPSRYCPNLAEHAHFHCKNSHRVYDIPLPESLIQSIKSVLPPHTTLDHLEIHFKGSINHQHTE